MYGEYHRQQTPVSLQLSHLFIVSPSARVICTKFSKGNVWLLDETHETIATVYLFACVWYNLNQCHISLCYCYMRKETTAEYSWAMYKLTDLFIEWVITHQLTFVTDQKLALMTALSELFRQQTYCYAVGISAKAFLPRNGQRFKHRRTLTISSKTETFW